MFQLPKQSNDRIVHVHHLSGPQNRLMGTLLFFFVVMQTGERDSSMRYSKNLNKKSIIYNEQ